MKELIVYPNCSKGGVTSVIRGRAVANKGTQYHALFFEDRGGRDAFDDLPNVTLRIVRKDRAPSYLTFLLASERYTRVSVLSAPDLVGKVNWPDHIRPTYEFHSSDMQVIGKEIASLPLAKIARFVAPSQYMANQIDNALPEVPQHRVSVVPNLVDTSSFYPGPATTSMLPPGVTPMVWIGRFDKGKGYRYFLRLLALLPERYFGVVIVSLEADPRRAADFLAEASAARVTNRIRLLLNLPQSVIGQIYREAVKSEGHLVSTSLQESFGYSVVEALECGLRVAAFDLPAFHEHNASEGFLRMAEIGDVLGLKEIISGTPSAS